MKKVLTVVTAVSLLLFSLLLSGCTQEPPFSVTSFLAAPLVNACSHTEDRIDSQLSSAASSEPVPASVTSSSETDMTGIPDIVSTIYEDPGNKLLLVNKLYTLSPDYYPSDMVAVDGSLSTNQGLYFKREAYEAYLKMLADAKAEGINFCICSTYRSYEVQSILYNNAVARDGAYYANITSAYPGRSEHQTGWAVDVTSASMGYDLLQSFIDYPEGLWINNHCSEYGFIIRYPKGKTHITGYDYEPWHLRYVGVEAAKEITASGLTLEEYLGMA